MCEMQQSLLPLGDDNSFDEGSPEWRSGKKERDATKEVLKLTADRDDLEVPQHDAVVGGEKANGVGRKNMPSTVARAREHFWNTV